jgi:uncharacterized membrane protein YbhN (UPF0104 family)
MVLVLGGAAVAVVVAPGMIQALHRSIAGLRSADRTLLGAGAAFFVVATVASGLAWHAVLRGCGVSCRRRDVVARYAVGSLANSLAPPPAGEAARITLVGRLINQPGAALTAGGVFTTVAIVRMAVVAALFSAVTFASPAGRLTGVMTLACAALIVSGVVVVGRRRLAGRLQQFAKAGRGLRESPSVALRLLTWVVASTAARVVAAACCCAALGVAHPIAAGTVIVPALELATLVPLVPANLGVTSAAVTLALQRHHVGLTDALSSGIALHAVETLAGISFGMAGTLAVARPGPGLRIALATAFALAGAAVGIWTFDAA